MERKGRKKAMLASASGEEGRRDFILSGWRSSRSRQDFFGKEGELDYVEYEYSDTVFIS